MRRRTKDARLKRYAPKGSGNGTCEKEMKL